MNAGGASLQAILSSMNEELHKDDSAAKKMKGNIAETVDRDREIITPNKEEP